MTKSILCSFAQATIPGMSVAFTSTHVASWLIPPLPGAQYNSVTLGLFFKAQQMACSRPPEPTTNTFMLISPNWNL